METTRLIEPIGLVHGPAAEVAVRAGVALPLVGGKTGFTLARLIEGDSVSDPLPVERIPGGWQSELDLITACPSDAGLPPGSVLMGILNVTPDSFSDGGRYVDPAAAVSHAEKLLHDGARILDIGAESTRPGSAPVSAEEEWVRLEPLLLEMSRRGVCISVDTRNARTMEAALDVGACLINDVTALEHDPEALPLLASRSCPVALMHMRGTPETMGSLTAYRDVAIDVVRELGDRITAAERAGISRERIIVDPGIGFAKTTEQNAELIRRLPLFANLGCRVLLGTSRKRMIGALAGVSEAVSRDPGTIASSLPGLALGGTILRVHDCAGMSQAMRVWEGCFSPA
ncbi:dihydropteroate synthase [Acetobacter sp.]|jgi:dihydropteroate synthase|uniref:dihydropteroate synthase n=1 Tax=Acetobacter sp. TaxID=440 RepID=UPI0025C1A77E|nr:dihydropteroate synthase [Acetobacter sp.]MCH4090267.1 dihydropteroate synthase [Acetobacter sp.]MCI1298961.1 dihydropteroate synthase [Acetobacter sp.]MCI1314981.1 dihydropteroate synthase [Acetobacter sp.]